MARLERYLALAFEAGMEPVILLTKPDLADDPAPYPFRPRPAISDRVPALALDARGADPVAALSDWCKDGADRGPLPRLVGGGEIRRLHQRRFLGVDKLATQAIREDDAKGRHTTTHRQSHAVPGRLPGGSTRRACANCRWPRRRTGIADLFDDITALAAACRFSDCAHETRTGLRGARGHRGGHARGRPRGALDQAAGRGCLQLRQPRPTPRRDRAFGKVVRQASKQAKDKRGL